MPKKSETLEILQASFKAEPGLKQKCIDSSKSKINRNLGGRVFDEFPILIGRQHFLSLVNKFDLLLQNPSKRSVREFEKQIIQLACDELLDEKGGLKSQIVDLLGWQDVIAKIDNYKVVSAFVGSVTSYVARDSNKLTETDNHKFSSAVSYINKNYSNWTLEILDERGIKYNPAYNTDQLSVQDIILYPIRKPGFTLSLFVGGMFGAALYGGYELCKAVQEDNATLKRLDSPTL